MKKLVIFDLDGTLLNTIADLAQSANYALGRQGYPVRAEAECRSFVGNGINKLLERALPPAARTPENVAKLKTEFMVHYDAHNADLTVPYPGIETLLKTLDQLHMKMAVLSNKYQAATERLVKHYFPQIPFAAVIGQREDRPVKPNPLGVEEILSATGVNKNDALYVGDSDVDIQTARNAGVSVCAVSWGFRDRSVLEAHAPDFIADTPLEILTMIR